MSTNNVTKGLIQHAKKFGTEGVMESARDYWEMQQITTQDVIRIQEAVDKLDATPRRIGRAHTKVVRHRLTAEERANRLLGINPEEGE